MIFDNPVAVLIGLDGHERVIGVTLPPPPVYEIAIPPELNPDPLDEPPQYSPIRRRVFRLRRDMRTSSVRWWEVYNEGRSKTPQDGFVYVEVGGAINVASRLPLEPPPGEQP